MNIEMEGVRTSTHVNGAEQKLLRQNDRYNREHKVGS